MADELEEQLEQDRTPAEAFAEILNDPPAQVAPAEKALLVQPQGQAKQAAAEETEVPEEGTEQVQAASAAKAPVQREDESDSDFKDRYWNSQRYIQKLHQEKAVLEAEARVRKEERERIETRQAQRQQTPEEREAEAAQLIADINKDPKGTLARLQQEALDKAMGTVTQKTEQMIQERMQGLEPMLAEGRQTALYRDLAAVHPEVKDAKFRALMEDPETVKAVWEGLLPSQRAGADAPDRLYKDPMFHQLLVKEAKLKAAQNFAPVVQAGAAAQVKQGAVARSQAQVAAGSSGAGGPAAAPKLSEDDQIRAAIRQGGVSPQVRMDKAFKPN